MQDIKRDQWRHSALKGEGECTLINTIPMETRTMVSSKRKKVGKVDMEK
jgi:hypothetical protein